MLSEGRAGQTLGESISDVASTQTLEKFDFAQVNTLPQKMILDINVAGSFAIDRVLAHQDTSGIIFPHLSRALLRAVEPIKERYFPERRHWQQHILPQRTRE
jgi:hypothetical protein